MGPPVARGIEEEQDRVTRAEVPCPLCGSEERERLFVSRLYADEVPVVRCRACGLLYQSPRPREADLAGMYDEKYYTGEGAGAGDYTYADERSKEPEVRLKAAARLARIETLVKPGRVVEPGCSFGLFLDEARRRGWDPVGVDVSPFAAKHVREVLRIPIHEVPFEEAPLEAGSARLVHMSEVIEHLPDPRRAIRKAAAVLEPGGLLVIGTANADSLARRLRGDRWGYYMPGHVVFFSAGLLSRLLREEGFEVLRVHRGDDHGRPFDGAMARAHATSVAGRLLRRIPIPGLGTVGAGMVVYGRKRAGA
jgi:SAM-dependent methyltransferase